MKIATARIPASPHPLYGKTILIRLSLDLRKSKR